MYRDNESGERYNIIQFSSDEFNEGHSVNTKIFLKAKELLKNEFDI